MWSRVLLGGMQNATRFLDGLTHWPKHKSRSELPWNNEVELFYASHSKELIAFAKRILGSHVDRLR